MKKIEKIINHPKILNFHINRMTFDNYGNCKKNDVPIIYPLNLKINNLNYTLKSLLTHVGGASYGHYMCINKTWYPKVDIDNLTLISLVDKKINSLNWCFTSDNSFFIRYFLFKQF